MRRPRNRLEDFAEVADGGRARRAARKRHLLSDADGDFPIGR